MKISTLRKLLFAVVCLFTGISANAQYSGSVEEYPAKDYASKAVEFTLSEVATTLGTDAATLFTAIDTYISAESTPDPILLYAVVDGSDVPYTDATQADGHGFWMTQNGTPQAYGDGCYFYISPSVDESTLAFYMGQMPNVCQEGDACTATIKLKFNDKEATFALTLNVVAKPVFDVPEATVIENQLQIVGEQEIVIEQFPRGGYDADAVNVSLKGVGALLGIPDMALLENQIEDVLYTTWYNNADVEEGGGMKKDSLTNVPIGEGHGFWYHAVQNANGEEDGEVAAAGWGGTDKFYMNNFIYADDSLSCQLGQYPGVCKENETWFAYVYIIYADKAYRIKYTLKLLEKEQGSGMSSYTKVGEASAYVEQEPTDDYSTVSVKPDVDAIAAALGCEVGALGLYALDDKDNFGGTTANNGGFWFSDGGTVVAWGESAAFFIEPMNSGDYSVLNVGQYPNHYSIGDEGSASLYFINGENYYQYTVTLKIVEPKQVEHSFESVATRNAVLQTRVSPFSDQYQCDTYYTIAPADIEALIGTTTPTLYGLVPDSLAAVYGSPYSTKYSCDPKPGFWLDKDGYVSTWGSSPVGISWLANGGGYPSAPEGSFEIFQMPGINSVGDVFKTTLFLVNDETNKMITINFNIQFVETLVEKEVVGSENLFLPVTEDGKDIEIDLTKAAEALDVTVEDLVDPNNFCLRGMKDGVYSEGKNADDGLSFNVSDGSYDGYGNMYFTIWLEGDQAILNIACNDPVPDDYSTEGQFCFEVNDRQYVYYVKFLSETLYEQALQGIADIQADPKAAQLYDLQGRQVKTAHRGLYILNGRKVLK